MLRHALPLGGFKAIFSHHKNVKILAPDPVLFLEGCCLIEYMRLIEFGLFHLLLFNFFSFVLCDSQYNYLVHVVASLFFLNYLPALAYFYYIHTPLFLLVPVFWCSRCTAFSLSRFTEKQEEADDCNEPGLYIIMLFFYSPDKVFTGKEPFGFCSSE